MLLSIRFGKTTVLLLGMDAEPAYIRTNSLAVATIRSMSGQLASIGPTSSDVGLTLPESGGHSPVIGMCAARSRAVWLWCWSICAEIDEERGVGLSTRWSQKRGLSEKRISMAHALDALTQGSALERVWAHSGHALQEGGPPSARKRYTIAQAGAEGGAGER